MSVQLINYVITDLTQLETDVREEEEDEEEETNKTSETKYTLLHQITKSSQFIIASLWLDLEKLRQRYGRL